MSKDVNIYITDNRPAYYFRKGLTKKQKERAKKVSNRSIMYALTFSNRLN